MGWSMLEIKSYLACGMVDENSYVLLDKETGKSAIIDPDFVSLEIDEILRDTKVELILLTHCHFDHIASAEKIRQATGAKILIHQEDAQGLQRPDINLSGLWGESLSFTADQLLKDGDKVPLGNHYIQVLHTPGHTKGSCCFLCEDSMFSGDMLFCGSVGRTDFPTGSVEEMQHSIELLRNLPQDYVVYPGHDQITSLAEEKRYNPYFR